VNIFPRVILERSEGSRGINNKARGLLDDDAAKKAPKVESRGELRSACSKKSVAFFEHL
jgi:hypothetical protein